MKQYNVILGIGSFSVLCLAMAATASASTISLTNGGLGQQNGDNSSFGFAVCNSGDSVFSGNLPAVVTANGVTQNVTVPISNVLAVGSCTFSYIQYATFNMSSGNTYLVTVALDPEHTIITNFNNQTSYSLVVPALTPSTPIPTFPNTGLPNNASNQTVQTIGVDLTKGNSGANVTILQQFLISQNKGTAAQALAEVGATGYFGALTTTALAEFQLSVGIAPDWGFFGPITRAYLNGH